MSAEKTIYVQVMTLVPVWRRSHGVIRSDAIGNVELNVGEYVTGETRYPDEVES